MDKVIECPCGGLIRSSDESDLVKKAQEHAECMHGMVLTKEQALAMARPE